MDRESALRGLHAGPPDLQRLAVRVLGRWSDDAVLDALIGALQSPHRGIREAAIDTLLEIGDARAVRLLVPLLKSAVPAVRNAARSLLQRLAKAAPEILIDLSRDSDVRMRLFAANIMSESGDHDLAAPLLDLLEDPDENVRDAAVVGLGRLGAPEAVHRLEQTASGGESWSRFSAIDALSQIPSPESARALLRILSLPAADLHEPVVEALGRLGSLEAVRPLLEKLHEPTPFRGLLVSTLAGFLPAEVAARCSPSDRVALAAAISERLEGREGAEITAAELDLLAELGVRIRSDLFVRPLSSGHRRVQVAAIRAATRLRLPDLLPLLRQLDGQRDPVLAGELREAFDVLGEAGKERS